MKKLALILAVAAFALAAAVGCSDADNGTPGPNPDPVVKPEWEQFSHAELLKLKGGVQQMRMAYVIPDAGEEVLQLDASFDEQGRCTNYDPTGIEYTEEEFRRNYATRDVWETSMRYTYTYDAQGRMTSATRYEVGSDPVVYTIAYGTHDALVVLPFPVGNIQPFLLRGVASISSEGYTLICDGETTEEHLEVQGWPRPSINQTTWSYDKELPMRAVTISCVRQPDGSAGEELNRMQTDYTYSKGWLLRTVETTTTPLDEETSEIQQLTTEYSSQWPCTVVSRQMILDENPDPEFRIEFAYMENGQPKSATATVGVSYTDQEFEQHYAEYDDQGNWTRAVRTLIFGSDREEVAVERTLTYY